MKIIMKTISMAFLSSISLLLGQLDHIIISEVVLTPSDGEYVEINNPTGVAVDLSNYYLTDATDISSNKFYYNLPSGENFWSESSSDFVCRFPSGYTIQAGSSLKISLRSNNLYQNTYGDTADLALDDSMLSVLEGTNTKGNAGLPKLSNSSEPLILFYWDGSSEVIKDVDYLMWGNNSFAIDKSSVSGYLADTPAQNQSFMPVHATNEKLARLDKNSEGEESESGGNGITGHDETSEPLAETWIVTSLTSSKPEISNLSLSPSSPFIDDTLKFEVNVTDDEGISSVMLRYEFQQQVNSVAMSVSESSPSLYSVKINPLEEVGSIIYSVIAEDFSGLKDSTSRNAVAINEPIAELTIASLLTGFNDYLGQAVQFNAVVTVPAGILRTNRVQVFVQDKSGRGILLDAPTSSEPLKRGDSISITGPLGAYLSSTGDLQPQIQDASINILSSGLSIPVVDLGDLGSIYKFNEVTQFNYPDNSQNIDVIKYMNSYVKLSGKIVSRSDDLGGGSNIELQDEEGAFTTVRIWNSSNILLDESGDIINTLVDSLLRVGSSVEIKGIGGQYLGSSQIQPAYASDISEKLEGEVGSFKATLDIPPYPFVPQLGEVISFKYSFPSDARIKLRVFDINGRLITTLYDEYRGVSFEKTARWNGRDNLNRLVPSGTYLIHLDIVNSLTGKNYQKIAPVVIAAYEN